MTATELARIMVRVAKQFISLVEQALNKDKATT
jgi:hypothetical protein